MTTLATTTDPKPSDLPEPVRRRGITEAQWRTLKNAVYPGAKSESVLMVLDYCIARQLDPLKRVVHIVPMEIKVGDKYEWRDVVLPGIAELHTTAHRTGIYCGHSKPEYGPTITIKGVDAPEWCSMTFRRWNVIANREVEFPVTIFFREVAALKRDGSLNARWSRAPVQMLTKCTLAAGLRETCPEEMGGQFAEEELDGQRSIDLAPTAPPSIPKPEGFDQWLQGLSAAAAQGADQFASAWKVAAPPLRGYLTAAEPDEYERLRQIASAKLLPIEPHDGDAA